ncbi:SIS domain-containing protein (plasmid) [Agrobacterium tumefaciens]|uniref:SIS domain-containing protein n=3 Tax=Rhizobium/Agrobacterium group TaxID=227290 RepID=A0AAE6EIB2_AGRTU|nr:SIS domain-containing protein [Agrobacterium genomosp. 6]QCL77600.1 SIS domain-containing protein [Agrobacterium tumefaciens]CUX71220.1 Agropine synthesis conjugase [Agrobacterium sp. NCPPB 925]ASK40579.1 hypothetical protein [Agrobacterium genomosp. 6]ASK41342.1 hypothetical protein [Agrobacterium genomosp. 6]QCL82923.1 SIS domain-containing protein [Agrobacterium tumefaciens]
MDLLYAPHSNGAEEMAKQLGPILTQLEGAANAGRLASFGLNQVLFVSAGAGLAIANSLKAYAVNVAKNLHYDSHASAAFVDMLTTNSSMAGASDTLVVLSSKSGRTRETVEAAKLLKRRACRTVVITMYKDAPLASFGHPAFFIGETTQAFHATHMLMSSFLGGILEMKESWSFMPALASSLKALPAALFHAAKKGVTMGEEFAKDFEEQVPLYFISSGSAVLASHVHGLCVLQEKLGLDVHVVQASDFFHSVLETVRPNTPARYILIIPEDGSRGRMLDVETFFETVAQDLEVSFEIIDTKHLDSSGIDPESLKILGPLLCQAFLTPWAPAIANATNKTMNDPLLHMGKFEYYNCYKG